MFTFKMMGKAAAPEESVTEYVSWYLHTVSVERNSALGHIWTGMSNITSWAKGKLKPTLPGSRPVLISVLNVSITREVRRGAGHETQNIAECRLGEGA